MAVSSITSVRGRRQSVISFCPTMYRIVIPVSRDDALEDHPLHEEPLISLGPASPPTANIPAATVHWTSENKMKVGGVSNWKSA